MQTSSHSPCPLRRGEEDNGEGLGIGKIICVHMSETGFVPTLRNGAA